MSRLFTPYHVQGKIVRLVRLTYLPCLSSCVRKEQRKPPAGLRLAIETKELLRSDKEKKKRDGCCDWEEYASEVLIKEEEKITGIFVESGCCSVEIEISHITNPPGRIHMSRGIGKVLVSQPCSSSKKFCHV